MSPMAQMVKNLLAVQVTWVQSLDQKDLPKKGMATHSNILAWRIPWSEDPGRLQSVGSQNSWTLLSMHTHTHIHTTEVSEPAFKSDVAVFKSMI